MVFVALLMVFVGVLLLLVPLVARQVESLIENLPRYGEWARDTGWRNSMMNFIAGL